MSASLDRPAFEAHVARCFQPATPQQVEQWFHSWTAAQLVLATLAETRALLEEKPSHFHGLAWWEQGPGSGKPAETDGLYAFLCATPQLGARANPHCPDAFVGSWQSPDGARLTLGGDGVYGLSRPSEMGAWRIHHSRVDELWIYKTGTHRRALEALRDDDALILRNLSGSPEQRWHRAP